MSELVTDGIVGAIAGAAATVPMTAFMQALYHQLPAEERYPLPPEEVEMKIIEEGALKTHLGEPAHTVVGTLSHFGYGSVSGAAYALLADRVTTNPLLKGTVWGLFIWGSSYLGWLPALNLISPATRQPLRRNALMITSHLVWGIVTSIVLNKMKSFTKNY